MVFHSYIEPIYWILPLLGFAIGLFGTMLGGGGGFFFLPILTLLLQVPAQTAVITSLVATLPIGLVGSVGHFRLQNIDVRVAMMFAVAGITGAFLGAGAASQVSSELLKTSFGIYSVLIAANLAYDTYRNKKNETSSGSRGLSKRNQVTKSTFFGVFAGLITGTFGTSGTAPVLAGLFSLHIPIKLVIGTSLLIVSVNTIFAISAHLFFGQIDLTLVCFLTSGSTIGAIAGPKLLARSKINKSEGKVRYWYATVMTIVGILMILG